ncbi:Endonuclease/Exonuclease/phosphatase family protein [Gillisia mitskevichiae]|uniref:Endonuclease/Exonuclease/phosphatase family protein n=1 Tax=Gillisia mitskevichiae TaxID=270921 RepID=A0A495PVP6_9FLAO|nr:Endonuclease/Exonuclease/phosphatase family protein [Gillisia mitskevichiae]
MRQTPDNCINLRKLAITIVTVILTTNYSLGQERKNYNIHTIAFYNVENLFDTEDDPLTFDDDRTPLGKDVWTLEKYHDKLKNIARVISEIGLDNSKTAPAIIGLCEIENLQVLEDLVSHPLLEEFNYQIIHYDSPDRRGVDVALLYQRSLFTPDNSQSRRLMLYELEDPTKRVFTRDQLVVSGTLNGEAINIIVNHWPSRSGGEAKTNYRREKAAYLNKQIIDSIYQKDPFAKILSMGDFNDDPTNKSFKKVLKTSNNRETIVAQEMFNPMENLAKQGKGSLAYRDSWNLFDQILVSESLLGSRGGLQFYQAGIFNSHYLITLNGQFRGYPFRSYDYSGYTGGFSDHFPVYIYLVKQE